MRLTGRRSVPVCVPTLERGNENEERIGKICKEKFMKKNYDIIVFLVYLLMGFSLLTLPVFSQQAPPPEQQAPKNDGLEAFEQSIRKAAENETANVAELEKRLTALEEAKKDFESQLQTYTIQNSAQSNLFLTPDVKVGDLEQARVANKASLDKISATMEELKTKSGDISALKAQATEQLAINERQLGELKDAEEPTETSKRAVEAIGSLAGLLSKKVEIAEKINAILEKRLQELKPVRDAMGSLASRFENQIADRKKKELFERATDQAENLRFKVLMGEFSEIRDRLTSFFSISFWQTELSLVWSSDRFYVFTSFVILLILVAICCRLGRFFDHFLQGPAAETHPWTTLALMLFRRSLLMLGTVLFFYGYSQLLQVNYGLSLFYLFFEILVVWLFTKWPIDFVRVWNHESRPAIPASVILKIRLLIFLIRYFATAYLILDWFISGTSVIAGIARFAFEIAFLLWTMLFWRFLKKHAAEFFEKEYKGVAVLKGLASAVLHTVAGAGLVMELAGFGKLAIYWYCSCGSTVIVLMWSYLVVQALRESLQKNDREPAKGPSLIKESVLPVRWLALRLSLAAVALLTVFFILLAWGAKQPLLLSIFEIFTYTFEIGQLRISLLNTLYAFLVIVATSLAVRYWRYFLHDKLLQDSGLETGLKDSVTAISVYLAWSIGILIALYAFGLSSASMAVAFGAVGIGLGFGLQNIFNNFISGIILLFERPIQVGDAIEINGTWGEVRKINVRSTLVQTYDNASLIIPNSEFISSQVTNWSFKDLRLRRTIVVGVAYGSDVELVRDTLYEIAAKAQRVLKYPEPVVLFYDFGDSALTFWLRIWTDVDYMLIVESEIRFEINRLFKERGIEIAFPQQDLHIRSVDANALFKLDVDKSVKD